MKRLLPTKVFVTTLLAGLICGAGYVPAASAAMLELPDIPIGSGGAQPNILLTLDTSGSMARAHMPDDVGTLTTTKRYCSSKKNQVYYDPNTVYRLPQDGSGNTLTFGDAVTFTNARTCKDNPFEDSACSTGNRINLSTNFRPIDTDDTPTPSYATCGQAIPQAAFYFRFNTALAGCDGTIDNESCYQKVTVSATSGPATVDINGDGVVDSADADERTNFAIWYSFYRTRLLAAKTAISLAFSQFPTNVRLSGQTLLDPPGAAGLTNSPSLMRQFAGTNRTIFMSDIFNTREGGTTPLRVATDRAGRYFSADTTVVSSANSPYRKVPGDATSEELDCRANFHILTTDGYWNGTLSGLGNQDNPSSAETMPATSFVPATRGAYSFDGRAPYGDSASNTLADVAMHYWKTDLRPDLPNKVPAYLPFKAATDAETFYDPRNDPADWQHMVTFTIGLGVSGNLVPANYNAKVQLKSALPTVTYPTWNDGTVDSDGEKSDDLWHAAVNSRAQHFVATNPDAFVIGLKKAVSNINARLGSGTALATNTTSISAGGRLFQAQYDAGWIGHLKAYKQSYNATTHLYETTEDWDSSEAANFLPYNTRIVITNTTPTSSTYGAGVPFQWTGTPTIDATQKAYLNDNPDTLSMDSDALGPSRLDFLRGSTAKEGTDFPNRSSTYKLGDVVGSSPVYVGKEGRGYLDAGYDTFVTNYVETRIPVVYVGSNDGMLHGFRADVDASGNKTSDSGKEVLAYVPNKIFKNLGQLTSPGAPHQFFVNGPTTVGDVYGDFGARCPGGATPCWRTILVGALGKGGQGYYALDVTNPADFTEANADKIFLWEFTDVHDADMGYTFGAPSIVKLRDGSWAVIVSNGYNNSEPDAHRGSGHGALFVLNIATGAKRAKLTLSSDGGTQADPNGLATPAAVDVTADNQIDYVYAGDVKGRMWKFDLTDASTPASTFTVALGGAALFNASTTGNPRAITTRPEVGPHPSGSGYMVYFGTGKLLEHIDNTPAPPTNYFYGIWDNGATVANNASTILTQTVVETQNGANGNPYRLISNNTLTWGTGLGQYLGWKTELPTLGEKQISDSVLRNKRILFTSMVPGGDRCEGGEPGWLWALNTDNGGPLAYTAFDTNNDGRFDSSDFFVLSDGTRRAASATRTLSAMSSPTVQNDVERGIEVVSGSLAGGGLGSTGTSAGGKKGRQSWRQLK